MTYALVERSIPAADPIEIERAQFEQLHTARLVTVECLAIEEKLHVVTKNYVDLEMLLHSLALNNLLFQSPGWSARVESLHEINRALLNVLAAARMYLDQVPQHLDVIFPTDSGPRSEFIRLTNEEFDLHFGYRLMSSLRNHAQHGGFSIESIAFNTRWIEDDRPRRCQHGATRLIHTSSLRSNSDLNAKLRQELATQSPKIDVRPHVRQYIGSILRLHGAGRSAVSTKFQESVETIRSATRTFVDRYAREPSGLIAGRLDGNGQLVDEVTLFAEAIERRDALTKHSRTVENLNVHFTSGDFH